MATAADLIQQAMETARIKGEEETSTSSAENTLGLKYLNDILEEWSLDGMLIYDLTTVTKTLAAGDGEYTIATSADINTTRPTAITGVYVTSGTIDYQLDIITLAEYDAIGDKTLQGIPAKLAYDPEYTSGRVFLWPLPDSAYVMTLRMRQPFTAFASSSTTVSFPPGYKPALVDALAIALCDPYDKQPAQWLLARAERRLQAVRDANRRVPTLTNDVVQGGGTYDVKSDQWL